VGIAGDRFFGLILGSAGKGALRFFHSQDGKRSPEASGAPNRLSATSELCLEFPALIITAKEGRHFA